MSTIIRSLVTLYFLAVVAYVSWGTLYGLGLPGYLTAWMLSTFNWSSDEITATLLTLGLLLPCAPFMGHFKNEDSKSGRVLVYLVCVLAPILLGFWGRSYLIKTDSDEQSLAMQKLTVSPTAITDLASKNLVRLKGGYLVDAALRYSKEGNGEDHVLYVPFVNENYQTEEISFVLVITQRQTPPSFLPAGQGQPYIHLDRVEGFVSTTFEGLAIEEQLPVYCAQEWNKQGLNLSDRVYRLEARRLVDGKLPSRLGHLQPDLAVYFGLSFGFAMFLAFSIGEWRRRT